MNNERLYIRVENRRFQWAVTQRMAGIQAARMYELVNKKNEEGDEELTEETEVYSEPCSQYTQIFVLFRCIQPPLVFV